MADRFTVTQTQTKPLKGPLLDLCEFVVYLEESKKITRAPGLTDQDIVNAALSYWDRQHGED